MRPRLVSTASLFVIHYLAAVQSSNFLSCHFLRGTQKLNFHIKLSSKPLLNIVFRLGLLIIAIFAMNQNFEG